MTRKLVLLRHGQSQWNLDNRFTGWVDVELTDQGRQEAVAAGRLMKDEGLQFDVAHTSVLKRAIHTLQGALKELDQDWLPVSKSWRLNERHYGGLQGLDKAETAAKHGEEQVKIWRRSYDIPPPAMDVNDPGHPCHDRRYATLDRNALPGTESLATTLVRVLPYWHDAIAPQLKAGQTVLVTAHGNSLRALYKYLNDVSNEQILELNIPTGIPLLFELDDSLQVRSFRYLGDPEAAKRAAEAVANQGKASNRRWRLQRCVRCAQREFCAARSCKRLRAVVNGSGARVRCALRRVPARHDVRHTQTWNPADDAVYCRAYLVTLGILVAGGAAQLPATSPARGWRC